MLNRAIDIGHRCEYRTFSINFAIPVLFEKGKSGEYSEKGGGDNIRGELATKGGRQGTRRISMIKTGITHLFFTVDRDSF